jgi:Fic family protein
MERGQLCGDHEVLALQNRNAVLQYDEIRRLAALGRPDPSVVKIDVAMLCHIHNFATADIFAFAGRLRDGSVGIDGTGHRPPPADEVPGLVDEMFKYVADNWDAKPIHLCSYLLWRCNWIHPFFNGNGRTTRGVAYLTFLLRLGYEPGGAPTFVDMISDDQPIYYAALDAADAAWAAGQLDVSAMEKKCSELLATQIMKIVADTGMKR